MQMNIGIVGLGLIGGSLAKTVKLHTGHRVIGCDLNPQTVLQAQLLYRCFRSCYLQHRFPINELQKLQCRLEL